MSKLNVIERGGPRLLPVLAVLLASCADSPTSSEVQPDEPTQEQAVAWEAIVRQQPLSDAASQIRTELEAGASAGLAAGHFASIRLAADKVIVRWKGPVPASVAGVLERARQLAPVEVQLALHSRDELTAAADRLADLVEAAASDTTPYIGVVIEEDRVRVLVAAGADLRAAAALLPRVGVPVAVEHGEPIQLKTRLDDSAPWFGGARFSSRRNGAGRASCTLGWGVTDGFRQYMLTAAHCATNPDEIVDPTGQHIGVASTKEDYVKDIILIDGIASAGGVIYEGGVGSGEYHSSVATWDYAHTGEHLCYSGSYGGSRCDFNVESFARSMYGCDSDGDCYFMKGLVLTSKNTVLDPVVAGDSGAPVFLRRSDGRVTAKGTLTGSSVGGLMWFAPISTAVGEYLIAPLTAP